MNKRTAELSAGLVAVKGHAAPSNDMPGAGSGYCKNQRDRARPAKFSSVRYVSAGIQNLCRSP